MTNHVRFAIVGYGQIGTRHADMIMQHDQCQLVGVADINDSLSEKVTGKYNVPFYPSIEELLSGTKDIDVVNICTPNGLHAKQSIQALEKGCHVVCEKPMGLTKAECEEVINKSLQISKHVFCVMQNRYSPPSVWLKSIIDEKIMGNIYMVQINCFWNRDERYYKKNDWKGTLKLDGGPLFTQFSHFLDIMYWLFGDINNIHARFDNFNHQQTTEFEDSGIVNFKFLNSKGIGVINYSTSVHDKNFESSITMIGEKGTVKVGGQYMDKIEYCDIKGYTMPELPPINPPNDYGPYKGSADNHHFVIQNVVDTIKGHSTVTTNALEGLKVVEIIERIYEQRKPN